MESVALATDVPDGVVIDIGRSKLMAGMVRDAAIVAAQTFPTRRAADAAGIVAAISGASARLARHALSKSRPRPWRCPARWTGKRARSAGPRTCSSASTHSRQNGAPLWAGCRSPSTTTEVHALRIGPDTAIVGILGMPAIEIADEIRRRPGVRNVPLAGYANEAVRCLPISSQHSVGGYEVGSAGFAPEAAGLLVEDALAALRGTERGETTR